MRDEQPETHPTRQPRAVVLRIWSDDSGALRGQIDDPAQATRTPFVGAAELLARLAALVQPPSPERNHPCDV